MAGASLALRSGKARGAQESSGLTHQACMVAQGPVARNKATIKSFAPLCLESLGLTRVPRIIRILT